jgi:hypothetical protein
MSTLLILIILFFVLFVLLMSVVYVYHWTNFAMGDSYIKRFTVIYLSGLILLSIPFLALLFT